MKKVLGLLCALSMAFVLTGCGGDEETTSKPSESKTAGEVVKKITVASDATYAPFEFLDGGNITGFDIDLLNEVAKEAGYEINYQNIGWDPLFASVLSKQVDMAISSITITDERKESYDFSIPYYESASMIMVKEGSTVKSATDLKEKKIGVLNGSTSMEAAEALFGKEAKNIQKYESNPLAVLALKNGEVEAVICDNATAEEYVKNNPNDKVFTIGDPTNFQPEYYGFMYPKGKDAQLQTDMNEGLKAVVASGKYVEIYKKYFGSEPNTSYIK